ncbi:sugar phosphate isomerase/epimerase [Variovorax sp. W1I1]|nr:sugar phosphate isomerase/epimerase [Variovorax sp. W1I1]
MATNIKGPGIYLAQFASDSAPFDSWASITRWAGGLGFKGVQIPSWDARIFDLKKAAESKTYCDEVAGVARENGVEITELGTHLQGQLVAVHPAYDEAFDGFAPEAYRRNPVARQAWAVEQMLFSAKASRNLGLKSNVSFPGALAWPYLYPWPPRPAGLIEAAFDELAKRWHPIFDAFEDADCNVCFELHPGEDLFDGVTFEMLLERVKNHPRCCINYDPSHFLLQQLDYLEFIDIYHSRIKALHIKDAEFRPTGRQGVYSGFQPWVNRAGRVPVAGRRADRLRRHLLEDGAIQLRQLGRARVGVLPQAPRGRRGRGRGIHSPPHHPHDRESLRRLRGRRDRYPAASPDAGSGDDDDTGEEVVSNPTS